MHIATVASKSQRSVLSHNDSKVQSVVTYDIKFVIVAVQYMTHGHILMTDQMKCASIVEKKLIANQNLISLAAFDFVCFCTLSSNALYH